MDRLTIAEHVKIVQFFYSHLPIDCGQFNRPTARIMRNLVKTFEETGTKGNKTNRVHHYDVRCK